MTQNPTSKKDIEEFLTHGRTVQLHPQGYSMYPMLLPGRDEAVISPVCESSSLKRGDVVLYRREGGILVLHRICKVDKSGFYFVGDNQTEVEGPLRREQIKGVLTAFIRNGREISAESPVYRLASRAWLFLRPARRCITVPVARLKARLKALFGRRRD